jgi:hypothetical protein
MGHWIKLNGGGDPDPQETPRKWTLQTKEVHDKTKRFRV